MATYTARSAKVFFKGKEIILAKNLEFDTSKDLLNKEARERFLKSLGKREQTKDEN